MKRLLGAILLIAMAAYPGRPNAGTREPVTTDPIPMLSSMDLLVIGIEDLDAWMVSHRARAELREMNRAMKGVCEQVRDVENLTRALSSDPQFRQTKAHVEELGRIQASVALLSKEISGWQATLRTLAEIQGSPSTPASDQDRLTCQGARANITKQMTALEARLGQMEAGLRQGEARPELCESAASLGRALQQLGPVIRAMDRLNADPGLDHDCLSQIHQAQDRLTGMIRQLESCHDCLAGMAPRS